MAANRRASSAAGGQKRKKVEASPRTTMIIQAIKAFYVAFCSIDIHSYFLWSSLVLAACGIVFALSNPNIFTFLCDISPHTEDGGAGCDSCSDQLLLCPKSLCYRTAMNITWRKTAMYAYQPFYQNFMQATGDEVCQDTLKDFADSPVTMIENLYGVEGVSLGCIRFHCEVLDQAMGGDTDLDAPSGTCTNNWGAKHNVPADNCVCSGIVTSDATLAVASKINELCGALLLNSKCPWGDVTPGWCDTTRTTTTTVTPGPASSRRLAGSAEPDQQIGALARAPSSAPAAKGSKEDWQVPSPLKLEGWGVGTVPANRGWANTSAPLRALQSPTPSAAAELNSVLQAYDAGAWSPCQCYQQCMPGIRTRLVTCSSNTCAEPKPPEKENCQCYHCADCPVVMWLTVDMIVSFSTSGVAGLLFLCFLYSSGVKEEQLIKIPLSKKLIGMNCKLVPPLVRLANVSTVFFVLLMAAMTFAHRFFGIQWSTQCYSDPLLRVVVVAQVGLVGFQVFLGRCAKRLCRRPAWLFSPVRNSLPFPFKQIFRLLRSLSP